LGRSDPYANGRLRRALGDLRRSLREFLTLPLLMIGGFVLLAALTYTLDRQRVGWLGPLRDVMRAHIFADAEATGELLGTIAGGIITVTSITFSLLLLAVQQSGASLTSQVFDQFLRRRGNQVFFGYFIGLALFALITLATVDAPFNPVYGATMALLLTAVALCLLAVLLYSTINQMRPAQIIEAIHDHTLGARERQLALIRRTRRTPRFNGLSSRPVEATYNGYVTALNLSPLETAIGNAAGEVEVVLCVSLGSFVSFRDTLARISAVEPKDAEAVSGAVLKAIRLEAVRDLDGDPAYGIQQLVTIAWTSVSTSKQNPDPGLLVTHSLRDLLARWSVATEEAAADVEPLPIVYTDDVIEQLMDAFAALGVVASESLQFQVYAEVVRAIAALYGRLPAEQQQRAEDLILRSLSALGEHVLTRDLDSALATLLATLHAWGRRDTAAAIESARAELRVSVGRLNSRATRVPQK
jgi:uncharacterized membrane protein